MIRTCLLFFLLLSFRCLTQNESTNFESFELPNLPQCWQVIDSDGDNNNWAVWYNQETETGTLEGNTGVGMMYSESFNNTDLALTPDNYLILPQLDIQAGEHLTYYVAGLDPNYSEERYSVVLSTSGNEPEDFTDVLFTDTLETSLFTVREVDLTLYEGQQVYIAFRHHNISDEFVLRLDDVTYPTTVSDCPIIVGVEEEVNFSLTAYPVPFTDVLSLSLPLENITVFSADGREVLNIIEAVSELNLAHLTSGYYFIRAEYKGTAVNLKVMK